MLGRGDRDRRRARTCARIRPDAAVMHRPRGRCSGGFFQLFEESMTMRTIVLVAALLTVGSMLHAQEPVVGVKDPESLFTDKDPTLNRNKQATLRIMRELLQCGQWDGAGEWLTQRYIQHNPNAASGRAGVVAFFTQVMKVKRLDKCDRLTTEVVAVIAEDDYVTVMMPRKYPDPR